MKSLLKFSFLTIPILILLAAPLYPQAGANGAISGFVTDPTGAAVAGVTVKATNVNTGVNYSAGTTTDGYYTIRFLIPSTYRVEVAQAGFKTQVVNNVVVQTASNPTVNISLTLGAVAQTVTVTDTTSLVEMQTADGGSVIDTKRVDDVPTMQRNATSLLYTAASVLPTSTEKTTTLEDVSKSSSQSINGSVDGIQNGFTETNDILVDGVEDRVSDSSSGSFIGYIPSQEAVSEVKVVTNPFSAEYGRTLGGVDAYTTKSGTSQFHGQAFEYNRDFGLSSTLFDSNRAVPTVGKTPLLANTPGGQIGGPLYKKKLFGFFSYEYLILHTAVVEYGTVPTAKMRQGDFSQDYYGGTVASPTAITLYDPNSCPTTGTATCTSRSVIGTVGDSVIPTSEMSPVAAALWNYIPLPNAAGLPITGFDNYYPTGTGAAPTDTDEMVSRVDYNISDNTRMTFRAVYEDWRGLTEAFYNIKDDAAEVNGPSQRTDHNDLMDMTHTFSPTSVLDVRVGMERFIGGNPSSTYSCRADDSSWGFSSTFLSQASHCMPVFGFTGNTGAGGSYLGAGTAFAGAGLSGNIRQPDYVYTLSGLFLKSMGKHTLKFGGQGFMEQYFSASQGHNSGSFSFTPQSTQQVPTGALQASQGDSVASFDMGIGTASLDVNSEPARQTMSAVWFVQDDIKVSRKLTLNVGLRWDWDSGLMDRFNAMMANFNTTAVPNAPTALATQVAAAAVADGANCPACPNLVGGPTFVGVNGMSRAAYDSTLTNFGPRLGAAYAFSPNTVVRAGWGLFYMPLIFDPGQTANGFSQTTSSVLFSSTNAVLNPITNPFPTGLLAATGSSLGLETNLGTALTVDDPHAREPRANQFNFNVQHELHHGILITVGYNYNGASRLPVSLNLDHLSLAQIQQEGYTALNTSVPNPFAGLMPASVALNKATTTQQQLLLPFPQYTGVTENYIPIGNAAYHGFTTQVNKRFSSGLSFSVAYTNSKHMDRGAYMNPFDANPGGVGLMKEIDPLDVAQFLNLYGVYEFPLGRGKPLGSNMPGWANQIFGGWQANWILRFQDGDPMSMNALSAPVPGVDAYNTPKTLDQWGNPAAFVSVYTTPYCYPAGSLTSPAKGNCIQEWSSVDSHLRGPGVHNVDYSVFKTIKITERVKFTFMTNFVNGFNSPQFYGSLSAGTNITTPSTFGKIAGVTAQTNTPRQIQLAGRLTF